MATIIPNMGHSCAGAIPEIGQYTRTRLNITTAWLKKRWQRLGGVTAVVGMAYTAVTFHYDLESRHANRINQAWSLIAAAKADDVGNIGLIEVLEYLHRYSDEVSLAEIQLPGAHLYAIDLTGADLNVADLRDANLIEAKLGQARLQAANLSEADLFKAVLNQASLKNANLKRAQLDRADLTGADLTGADLTDTLGLIQSQLDTACGSESTVLPRDLTIPFCVDSDWWEEVHDDQ